MHKQRRLFMFMFECVELERKILLEENDDNEKVNPKD
jgi:hypothetical protein